MMTNKRIANRQHRWLSSVEITGVVFSEPVLADAGNFRTLDKQELAAFRKARDIWNLPKGMMEGNGQPAWLKFIWENFLGLKSPDYWQLGAAIPPQLVVNLAEHQETIRPSRVLVDAGSPLMLVLELPREQSLDRVWMQERGRWKASPTTKFERLLRETGVELGLLTNGEAWRLVVASPSETTSWLTWTAQTWNDDPLTLAAFKDLLGESRFFAGSKSQVVLELIKQSRQRQLDVADQLGNQVCEALDILVHEFDRIDAELEGKYLVGYSDAEIFESAVAFIMRLLFTLYAEENGLLPHGNVTYDRSYGVLHLLTELEDAKRLAPEKLKHSFAAYARLLAGSRLLHDGSIDPDIRIAAHGGQLFDPNRYPLLEGRCKNGGWPTDTPEPPKVCDAVVRNILRSLKYARADGVPQLVSYRTLAVEQIGHMYEGLLDRRVARAPADKALVLLQGGSKIKEPDPVVAAEFSGLSQASLVKTVSKLTSRTANTLKTILERPEDRSARIDPGTDDATLLEQVAPVLRFIRDRGIVRPGGRYVTHGRARRSSSAHYTPPTLTAPVVRRTLEHHVYVSIDGKPGLLVEPRVIKTPREILNLKVCDPAMGSGAFLVQATRYLAERLVDAWEKAAADNPGVILSMPFAESSQGLDTESLLPESREERMIYARRYVAERCIYGVDANRLAVEMAKLSLWLATLSTDRPFTFVDHALKQGDSLVGLTLEQIHNFTWKPIPTDFGPLFAEVHREVEEAQLHRDAIHDIPDHDFARKEQENRIAEHSLNTLRLKAALAIAAFFNGENNRQRENNLATYRYWVERQTKDDTAKKEIDFILAQLTTGDKPINPFCWEIEFPEVFQHENCGFDAFIGNPPFAGKNTTIEANREYYSDWLKLIHEGSHGNSDIVAHFFRRAFNLLRKGGSFGLIATKTIRQGDTRSTGLKWISAHAGIIYEAKRRVPWPGKAVVIVSLVFCSKGLYAGAICLDGRKVSQITAYLFDKGDSEDPYVLKSNTDKSFQGSIPLGIGFTFDDTDTTGVASSIVEMQHLIKKNPRNAERIFPYIGGAEVNDSPIHQGHRFIINFFDMDEEEAGQWPDLLEIVKTRVRPERLKQKDKTGKQYWWRFLRPRPALYNAISAYKKVMVTTQTSKYRTFTFLQNGMVYDQKLIVFAMESFSEFCVMHSRFHEEWALFFGSTMKDDPVYTPSDCFETFPFPAGADESVLLKDAGLNYYNFRTEFMTRTNQGLTATFNRFHNPDETSADIQRLRALHQLMDAAVLQAYGWEDLDLQYVFEPDYEVEEGKAIPWRFRWPDELRDEILGRLLTLNEVRHKQETYAAS